jgi:hypothetical protein
MNHLLIQWLAEYSATNLAVVTADINFRSAVVVVVVVICHSLSVGFNSLT